MSTLNHTPTRPSTGALFREAGKAIGIAIVVNTILYYILSALGWIHADVPVTPDGQVIDSPLPVIMSTIMPMIIGTLIFWPLSRYAGRPAAIFTWIVVAGFLISLANPFFMIQQVPLEMGIALDILHIPPAFFLWRFLTRTVSE